MGSFDVGMVDVIFKIIRDGSRFGRLKVLQGGVEWQRGGDKKHVYSMSWIKFHAIVVGGIEPRRKTLKHKPLRHRHV